MAVEIREPDLSSYEPLVQLRVDRLPRVRRAQAEWPFVHAEEMAYLDFRAAYDGGALVGWANALRGRWFPPGIAMISVTVARQHERRGVGGALYRTLLASLPPEIETIGAAIDDAETESLDIARTHGFEVTQHGIESELELVDLPEPQPGAGVTLEDVSSLEFPDEDAVEALLRDSQTNPEAAEGFVSTLGSFREISAKAEHGIAALARVDEAPAAIIIGDIEQGVLGIAYTGVGRAYRGRDLAFTLKQYGHVLAAEAGATVCHTMNEESNVGIRRINAKLGYQVVGGAYRLRARRELVG
ncbi:GNAT family N-acetyltransferase [Nocardioides sp. HM23]|uniref:GNAT family N-acetyltransferase n=1 Tax=Nocardioides bizhenqiangii TaxID=3095076 RepID=UPI002ACA6938|nr:GNAT family N-acetyltransferase [Nocardioides sp. HM23]MDZ5622842.1 GNAT family N-acetyltransferase [Nocardioides sp. HM23]